MIGERGGWCNTEGRAYGATLLRNGTQLGTDQFCQLVEPFVAHLAIADHRNELLALEWRPGRAGADVEVNVGVALGTAEGCDVHPDRTRDGGHGSRYIPNNLVEVDPLSRSKVRLEALRVPLGTHKRVSLLAGELVEERDYLIVLEHDTGIVEERPTLNDSAHETGGSGRRVVLSASYL